MRKGSHLTKPRKSPSSFRSSAWNGVFAARRKAAREASLLGEASLSKCERQRLFNMPWEEYKKLKGWEK